jgi:PAS domain S-box-containing protein
VITLDLRRLEETADFGRALIARLPGAGLLIIDADLRILLADGDVFRDVDHGGIIGRRVPEVIPAAAWEILEARYDAALDGHVQTFDYEAADSSRVYAVRLAPIRNGDAAPVGVMVLTQDTTEKAAAIGQLAGSERLQRSVLEVLDEGVIVLDSHLGVVQANGAASAILGLDLGLVAAGPRAWKALALWRASDGSSLEVGADVLRTGEAIRDVDVRADRPDGTSILLSVNYQPLRDIAGGVSGLVLSFRDVSEREREHRRLVESQDRLREAHEVARLSSWEWQPETGEMVIFQSLAEDGSLPGTRVALEDVLVGIPEEERQPVRDDLASIVRGERDAALRRYCQPYPTGSVWLETRSRAVRDADGRLVCVRGTTQDVTAAELAKQQAAGERDFLQATLDSLPAHIAVLGEQGEIVMTNRAWVEFAAANGAGPGALGENYLVACDGAAGDELAARVGAGLRAILSGTQAAFSLEYPCHSPTVERWFVLRAARFEGPGSARIVVAHDDVSQRRWAEGEVATQAALLEEVDVAVVATDVEGRITHWNRGAQRLHGWAQEEVMGRNAEQLISPPGTNSDGLGDELRSSGRWEGEYNVRHKDGSTSVAYLRGRQMLDGDGQPAGWTGVSVDLTERLESERAVRAASNYLRAVTDNVGEGLFTLDTEGRLTYMNAAAEILLGWPSSELQGRLMHDVTHGRRADGSALPIEECAIMNARRDGQTVRVDDDIFVRRDGQELPVAYTAAPFETDDGVHGCVVVFEDISERKATEESLRREAEKLSWIGRVQDALAEDRFVLYAQPIVDLRTGDVVQRELLLRIREPNGEIVGPGAFLPIAEQYGLIGDIDRWVVERGAEIAASGRPVEINLSARSVGDRSILDHIELCIEQSGADPKSLVFEITETALIEDEAAARVFAERLHKLGCKLALDDFGTGYGGFTYLKRLPLDFLKIDIEFVRDLPTNPASSHVVQAVVALAGGFKLKTVAEGVEDAETLDLLRELGVDFAQGYHIARPGPLDEAATGAGLTT